MTAYLTVTELKLRAIVPGEWFDDLETRQAGWLDAQLEQLSRYIDARLMKRYAVPFATPVPEAVKNWLARLMTAVALHRRGFRAADDETVTRVGTDEIDAKLELKEAADSVTGLFDLPLAGGASGISKGGPKFYSEQSPYVAFDGQAQVGRNEDRAGRGTTNG